MKASDLVEANKRLIKEVRTSLEEEIRTELDDKYLSREEVAKMLNVTLPTLWRWEKVGYLKPSHMGGKVLYRLSEVRNIMNQKKK